MSGSFNSYPKIFTVGHKGVSDIFMHKVIVQEKIDGSQFSFGKIEGRLRMKSHRQDISDIRGDYGMFSEAIAYVVQLFDDGKLKEGYTYRGEVLSKPLHNQLEYKRVPKHNIVGYDIAKGEEDYLPYIEMVNEFLKLDLEVVPYYYFGVIDNPETIKAFLSRQPLLGGKMIEGIVIKAHGHFGEDKKTLMAKLVSEEFKEAKQTGENQPGKDLIEELIYTYRCEARWDKAIQYLKEQGKLLGEPRDIGPLIGRICDDLREEEGPAVAAKLMKRYWPHIARGVAGGFADYYKRKLMEGAFAQDRETLDVPVPMPVDGQPIEQAGSSEREVLEQPDPALGRPGPTAGTAVSAT